MKFYSINILFLILFQNQNSFKILDLEVKTSEERINKILNIYFKNKEKINIRMSKDLFLKFLIDKNTEEIFLLKKNDEKNKNLQKYLLIEDIILEFLTKSRIRILRKKKAEQILKSKETFKILNQIIKRKKKFENIRIKKISNENKKNKKISSKEKNFKTKEL